MIELKITDLKPISDEELWEGLVNFIGKEFLDWPKEKQQSWIDSYRKAEQETNNQILAAGSVEEWYASGQGRVFDL